MDEHKTTLRMGMVGGGPGAFIGSVHRMAAELDLVRRDELEAMRAAFTAELAELRAELAHLRAGAPSAGSPQAGAEFP